MDLSCYLYKGCCQLFLSAENAAKLLRSCCKEWERWPRFYHLHAIFFPLFSLIFSGGFTAVPYGRTEGNVPAAA